MCLLFINIPYDIIINTLLIYEFEKLHVDYFLILVSQEVSKGRYYLCLMDEGRETANNRMRKLLNEKKD